MRGKNVRLSLHFVVCGLSLVWGMGPLEEGALKCLYKYIVIKAVTYKRYLIYIRYLLYLGAD